MSTLLLRLAGPLQSWGAESRFNHRLTRSEPTKSGVLGLLAAAQGRRRSDPIEDLLALRFGVRTENPGTQLRDFQTEIDWRTTKAMPLTNRYYLADAVFLAAIDGPDELMSGLREALLKPTFPIYLGRRSCPPAGPLFAEVRETSFDVALRQEPWRGHHETKLHKDRSGRLPIVRDCLPGERADESIRDVPISFDIRNREYGWRDVVHEYTKPLIGQSENEDDAFATAEEANRDSI
uniref:type I-E CRISPR-associated protein Cas5/CasD n=1 Tax=Vaginimicrobium propionicum TaxID=1871034 RepID=UPI000970F3DA|nr:type I-E CRISPR-associated protein Cas5/CasD [Vaginimicrobium propionicum]